ncbi:MAG TPA: ribosome small subunit-dependent GTPase A [Candidatus Limnocylindrales bacterium]|nr:ribosome small subunit-dependent GTPase A [Candidatus Limnocylindrales bacterium]
MRQGTVIRAAGGFFAVSDGDGRGYLCRARGLLKREKASLMVGDRVLFVPPQDDQSGSKTDSTIISSGVGVIEELIPRTNRLSRPLVANVDQLVIVMSLKNPPCDWQLVSRLLILAESEELAAVLCLNKVDLLTREELKDVAGMIEPYPYPVYYTSAVNGDGIESLQEQLVGFCSVFAGPSGVGKSSLLNAIQPGLNLKEGPVSDKIKRGRHTTRQAELLLLDGGGTVVDTPGFSRLDFTGLKPEQLPGLFPEFDSFLGLCAFRNCMHLAEPDCAVQQQVGDTLNAMRYGHYKYFMTELLQQQR